MIRSILMTALMAVGASAEASSRYEYREVTSVQPLIQQQCYEDQRRYYGRPAEPRSRTAPVLGAIVGGALGNQIGDGDGRRAATVAGAALGYTITRDAQERERVYVDSVPVCEHVVTGYRVTYRGPFGLETVTLPYNPGRTVRVRVETYVE